MAREKQQPKKRQPTKRLAQKPSLSFVGAGRLASFLAPALASAGYKIREIILREHNARNHEAREHKASGQTRSLAQARALARRVGAKALTISAAALHADALWLAVPDGEIRHAAASLAHQLNSATSAHPKPRFVFHSSGALASQELGALRNLGIAAASIHPLMTFVARSRPSLAGVPFAIEGDAAAVRAARAIVRNLGAQSFALPPSRKASYHAWATMTSPLLVAYLVAMEPAARAAGLDRAASRRMSLPILRQTLENYSRLGPAGSFSGPFIRGDVGTITKHLALLKRDPKIRALYVALGRIALHGLPVKNRPKLLALLNV